MKKIKLLFFTLAVFSLLSFDGKKDRPLHIFMAGDSTMADKVLHKTVKDSLTGEETSEPFPERGWGMLLPEFFTNEVTIENYAKNGRSTRTFIEERLWDTIAVNVQKGDYVIIQFGHNDSSEKKTDRYTTPADYKLNLIRFIDQTRAKGANPILCTPVVRRKFDKSGKIIDSHGVYTNLVREVANEKGVLLVDMHERTREWLNNEGVDKSATFFMHIAPRTNKIYPNGLTDNTHFVEAGARKVAGFFITEIEKAGITDLTKCLK